jgi:hypothetical protein
LDISQEKNKLKKMEQGIPKISTPPGPVFLMGIAKKSKKNCQCFMQCHTLEAWKIYQCFGQCNIFRT